MLVEVDGAWAPGVGDPPSSCAGYADDPDLSGEESGMYWIAAASETVMAYCDMENEGGGGPRRIFCARPFIDFASNACLSVNIS